MDTKDTVYVGFLIRDEIRKQKVKNGFVIAKLQNAGIEISETVFSSKLYGERDTFNQQEVDAINNALGTTFTL